MGYPMVWVSFLCIEKKWVKFEFWNFLKKFPKFFSYFLTFWQNFIALVDNFQRQEDLILWNFLCDNCGKNMSADFSCLFTFSKKKRKKIQIMLALVKSHHKLVIMVNFQIYEIFIQIFGGVATKLKISKILKFTIVSYLLLNYPCHTKVWKKFNFFWKMYTNSWNQLTFFLYNCHTKNFIKSNLPGVESCLLGPNILAEKSKIKKKIIFCKNCQFLVKFDKNFDNLLV